MRTSDWLLAAIGLAAFPLSACSSTEDKPSSDGLRAVDIPKDFTFATSHSVDVRLVASQTLLGTEPAAVEISQADGAVLFRGALSPELPLALKLAVPTKDQHLVATLFVQNQPQKAVLDIVNGAAQKRFD